jgi:hypothetical protein
VEWDGMRMECNVERDGRASSLGEGHNHQLRLLYGCWLVSQHIDFCRSKRIDEVEICFSLARA